MGPTSSVTTPIPEAQGGPESFDELGRSALGSDRSWRLCSWLPAPRGRRDRRMALRGQKGSKGGRSLVKVCWSVVRLKMG